MILDTFSILFQADTKALDKGLKDSDKSADKLTDALRQTDKSAAGLGAEVARLNDELAQTDSVAAEAGTSVATVLKSMAGMAAGLFAMGAISGRFTETINELDTIGRTADSLNLPVEDVDAFGRSMIAMGGDAQGARDSLVDMAESIGEAVQDVESGRAKVYQKLGIALKDVNGQAITATEGMLRLSDAVAGMSKEEAIFRIKELGITDNRTVELILKGRKEMERMLAVQKEQSAVTKESVALAQRYQESMGRLQNAQDSIVTQMTTAMVPALTKVIDWVAQGVEWMGRNSQTVTAFFGAIAAVIAAVYLPAMLSAAAATLAATWPLIAIGAIVASVAAAFALLYDDVQNFLAGNESLIGQISEKYPIIGQIVTTVADAIGAAWAGVKDFIVDLWDAVAPLGDAIGGVFAAVGDTLGAFLSLIGAVVAKVADLLGIDLGGAFRGLGGVIGAVMDGAVAVIKAAVSYIIGAVDMVAKAFGKVSSAIGTVAGWLGMGDDGKDEKAQAGGDAKPEAAKPEKPTATTGRVKAEAQPVSSAASRRQAEASAVSPVQASPKQVEAQVAAGNKALGAANASPLNAVTSNSITNSNAVTNRETNVNVGEVVVNTQATDAQGIAKDVGGSLEAQLAQVDSEFSTGRAR